MTNLKTNTALTLCGLKDMVIEIQDPIFITICTDNRQQFFGACTNGQMHLSSIGEIAHRCWKEIPDHFPNATLGAFIIMPDHMHGILSVQMLHATSPQSPIELKGKPEGFYQEISPKTGSISTIIRSYKSAVSKFSRIIDSKFQWQSLFHDHIIWNQVEYDRIHYYILNNPQNWKGKFTSMQ